MTQISIDDLTDKRAVEVVEDFLPKVYHDWLSKKLDMPVNQAGLMWTHDKIYDDLIDSGRKDGSKVFIQDDNTVEGNRLIHRFDGSFGNLHVVAPFCMQVAERHGEQIGVQENNIQKILKTSFVDSEKYYAPRIMDRSDQASLAICFLNTCDAELLIFDKKFMGARPKEVKVEQRIPWTAGTVVFIPGNKFYSQTQSLEDASCIELLYMTETEMKFRNPNFQVSTLP